MVTVSEYLAAKRNFEAACAEIDKHVSRVYSTYSEEKDKVVDAARKAGKIPKYAIIRSWSSHDLDSYKFKGTKIKITGHYSFNGGGCSEKILKVPIDWISMSDDDLLVAVRERLEEERIDIELRERRAEEARAQQVGEKERAMLAILTKKYSES